MSRRRKGIRPVESLPGHFTVEFVCTGIGSGHPRQSFGHVHVAESPEADLFYELDRKMFLIEESEEWLDDVVSSNHAGGSVPPMPMPRSTITFRCSRCRANMPMRQDRFDALVRGAAERNAPVFDISRARR